MFKHSKVLEYIEAQAVGFKLSVRQIARNLKISEGTAYRGLKDAENYGLVKTIPRVGTIRIFREEKKKIEELTFAEVVNIVDGNIIGGRDGLAKTLSKFVIGAMEIDAMKRYIEQGSLLIVGNRMEAQKIALEQGAGVLVTGGFQTTPEIKRMADDLALPVIASSYDTFTVATMINRAISERLVKKEIILVEDILTKDVAFYLYDTDTVGQWRKLLKETGHSRFPIVDAEKRVVGMITPKDVADMEDSFLLNRAMTKKPITIGLRTPVAYAAHLTVWEGIELIPVVENERLVGVVSRHDIMKELQNRQKHTHIGETFDDLIIGGFQLEENEQGVNLKGKISPTMLGALGITSTGVQVTLLSEAANALVRRKKHIYLVPESMNIYFIRPVQLDSTLEVSASFIDIGRREAKLDLCIKADGIIASRAMMSGKKMEDY